MITENEYLIAKRIVEQYEKQQQIKIERFQAGDIDLLTVLSVRAKNVLIKYNEYWAKDGDEIIYVSDVVKAIKKDGSCWVGTSKKRKGQIHYGFLLKMSNLGFKSYDEIMSHVRPFL